MIILTFILKNKKGFTNIVIIIPATYLNLSPI